MSEPPHDHTRPDLHLLLAFWQPTLGLRDWVFRVEYDRTLTSLGRTTAWWRDREARVLIRDPAMNIHDWPPGDVELTFVHELVHCVLDPFTNIAREHGMAEDVREQQVEQLAKSFIRLHRVYPFAEDWLAPTRPPAAAWHAHPELRSDVP